MHTLLIILRDVGYGVGLTIGLAAYLTLGFLLCYAFSFRRL